jgi:hypothetical protein
MKITFDKEQWEIDSEFLHPFKFIEFHNFNKSVLGYIVLSMSAFILFVLGVAMSPLLILNSVRIEHDRRKH